MDFKEVKPEKVTVSTLNERSTGEVNGEFVENIQKKGVKQPVLVHSIDEEEEVIESATGSEYAVFVGGRRVRAARQGDIDSIPIVVVDEWDDGEALASSIIENIDEFKKSVSKQDRALALEQLKNKKGLETDKELADFIGVPKQTIGKWLEYTRDEWDETSVSPTKNEDGSLRTETSILNVDDMSTNAVRDVRNMTGGGERGEEGRPSKI